MRKSLIFAAAFLLLLNSCSDDLEIDVIQETQSESIQKISLAQNRTDGYNAGYFWTVYKDGGSADITFPHANQWGGNFQLSYSNTRNTIGGKGWQGGANRNIGYNIGALWGTYNFVGAYGWTTSPDVEYYVVEKGNGAVDGSYQYVGEVRSNGNRYSFYRKYITNQPCALKSGPCNFWQYKNIRINQTGIGKNQIISLNNHANAWRGSQSGFGSYTQYQVFGIETYSGNYSGNAGINATIW